MTLTERFEIVAARSWLRDDGKTASLYGSIPWTSDAEKSRWKIQVTGWTIRDHKSGTIGLGQRPFETYEQAQDKMEKLISLYA